MTAINRICEAGNHLLDVRQQLKIYDQVDGKREHRTDVLPEEERWCLLNTVTPQARDCAEQDGTGGGVLQWEHKPVHVVILDEQVQLVC